MVDAPPGDFFFLLRNNLVNPSCPLFGKTLANKAKELVITLINQPVEILVSDDIIQCKHLNGKTV
jgi:hypothetical protein